MKSQLYLYSGIKENYINDLTQIKDLFFERIHPVFADCEKEAAELQNKLWEDMMDSPCASEDDIIDPADYVDAIQDAGIEKYQILSLMKYRNMNMWVCCLCQVWEQQLFSLIYNEARSEGLKYDASDLKRGFAFSKEVFEWHQQPLEKLNCWFKIKELRLLVNVIKHSEGYSEEEVRKIRPNYFEQNVGTQKYDLLALYHSTLLEKTLQIQEQDFIDYYDALIQFWNELPERMYTAD